MQKSVNAADSGDALEYAIAAAAAAMADASRVKILCALMDGRAWTATELSAVADIASSTASGHLARLVGGGLITCLSQGRHRYYRLAGSDIAGLIETMMGVSWRRASQAIVTTPVPLRAARTCYDHLAGEAAVKIFDALVAKQWLTPDGSALTDAGLGACKEMGIALGKTRRRACCGCLDWSERRFHLGGEAGAVLFAHAERHGWLTRTAGYREVTITSRGRINLNKWMGVTL